jgi:hypothetical protein
MFQQLRLLNIAADALRSFIYRLDRRGWRRWKRRWQRFVGRREYG